MNAWILFLPFLAVIALMFGWSLRNLVREFNRRVIWKEETVVVSKSYNDGLAFFSFTLGGEPILYDRLPENVEDGREITFIYPPGKPQKAKPKYSGEGWGYSLTIFIIGCVFSAIIFSMMFEAIDTEKTREARLALKTTGRKIVVPAKVAEIVTEESPNDPDKFRYWIKVIVRDEAFSDSVEFYSNYYKFDPANELMSLDSIVVYADPARPDFYKMEIGIEAPITDVSEGPPPFVVGDEVASREWICLIFGLVVIAACSYVLYTQYQLVSRGERAVAKVVSFITTKSQKGYGYSPFVQFTTLNGRTVRTEIPESSNPPAYEIGDQVTVYYQPDNIDNITTLNYTFIIFPSVMMFVGAALMMAGIYFFNH